MWKVDRNQNLRYHPRSTGLIRVLQRIGSQNYVVWQVPKHAVSRLETQESQWYSFSVRAYRLKTQDASFSFSSKEYINWYASSRQSGRRKFTSIRERFSLFVLLRSSTDWMCRIHVRGQHALLSSIIQKHPHGHTQNNVWSNIWAPQCASQVDIKWTITPRESACGLTYYTYAEI